MKRLFLSASVIAAALLALAFVGGSYLGSPDPVSRGLSRILPAGPGAPNAVSAPAASMKESSAGAPGPLREQRGLEGFPAVDPTAHPSVRRMTAEVRTFAAFAAAQQSRGSAVQRSAAVDDRSSAVLPFGPVAREPSPVANVRPEPIAKTQPEPVVEPMKANRDLAFLTQQAQRDVRALVEALKAAESK